MVYFFCFCGGVALSIGAFFFAKYRGDYKVVTLYEVPDGMVPVDRDLLVEIDREYQSDPQMRPNAYESRRQMRLDLGTIQVQFRRLLTNAARPRKWASSDWRVILKNNLEHSPEVYRATKRVMEDERELRRLVLWVLFRVWLWNLSRFHEREWGPTPDMCKFCIGTALRLYDNLRLATVHLARCYGEAAVAEEIAASM